MENHEFQTTLGEIASFRRGVSYKGSELAESEVDGTPMINMKSFTKDGKYRPEGIKFHNGIFKEKDLIKPDEIVLANTDLTKEGDILGAAIMLPVELQGKRVVGSHHTTILTVSDERVNPTYLARIINSVKIRIEIKRYRRGATVKGIVSNDLKRIAIQIPSLDEQKRIADILDKADEIKKNCAKTSEIRDEIIRSTFLEMFGDLNINPKRWKLVLLNDLVDKLGDGIHGTPVYDENGDYFFINGTNLRDKKIKILENTKRVNELEYLKHKKELNASTMFVSINGTVGNVAYYNGEPVMLGKSVCYFNVKESEVSKTYLYYLIKSNYFTNYARGNSTGSTIRNLSLKAMRNFPIPLPPINIQNEFEILIQNISEMGINLSMQNTELLNKSITQSLIG